MIEEKIKVMYKGVVPQFLQCRFYRGRIKKGDIIDITRQNLIQLKALNFEEIKEKKKGRVK